MGSLINDLLFSNSINVVINLSNIALFILGMVLFIAAGRYLLKNRAELKAFKQRYQRNSQTETSISPKLLLEMVSKSQISRDGVLFKTIDNLRDLSKSSMDERDKLMYFEQMRNETRTAIPKTIPTIAVIIGFLGTVIGLFLAINEMPKIIDTVNIMKADSFKVLLETMAFSLTGMGIAFGTTLVGLTLSLTLTICNLGYRVLWGHYDSEFHEFLVLKLFPVFMSPEGENIIEYLVKTVEESREAMKTIQISNARLLQSVNELSTNLKDYNQENARMIQQVSRVVKEFVENQQGNREVFLAIKTMAEQAGESYQRVEKLLDTSSQDRQAFMAYLQDSRNEIREISKLQHNAYKTSMEKFLDDQQKQQTDFQQHFADMHQEFFVHHKNLNQTHFDQFVNTHEKFQSTFNQLVTQLLERVERDNSAKLTEFIKQNKDMQEAMKGVLTEFKQQVIENSQDNNSVTTELIAKLTALIQQSLEKDFTYIQGAN